MKHGHVDLRGWGVAAHRCLFAYILKQGLARKRPRNSEAVIVGQGLDSLWVDLVLKAILIDL